MHRTTPVVPHREELIYLLSEAAEVEHCLMCCYLYAGFSLKGPAETDLSTAEHEAVERWRRSIHAVATEEMLHLALVQNLLTSIGATPHLQRPNFPVSPGIFPSGIVVQLRRFDAETLDHFIYLERPEAEEAAVPDGFEHPVAYARPGRPRQLMASAQDYATVGALYHGIEQGFEELAAGLGEKALFVGDPGIQVGPDLLELDGLATISDLASVRRAIEGIIEQGEGARRSHDVSHYERFRRIRAEYEELKKTRPDFEPAHPVVGNPVMNEPTDPAERAFIDDPAARRVLDLANASYGLMVQCLARFFGHIEAPPRRRVLVDVAIEIMAKVLAPLAKVLATLPASTRLPGQTAGLTFTLPRTTHALSQPRAGWSLMHERATELAAAAAEHAGLDPVAAALSAAARRLAPAALPVETERG